MIKLAYSLLKNHLSILVQLAVKKLDKLNVQKKIYFDIVSIVLKHVLHVVLQ